MGEKFNKKLLEEMRVLGMPIPHATDRPDSGTNAVSSNGDDSASRVPPPRATDRPASRTNAASNDGTIASRVPLLPPPMADTISSHDGTSAVTSQTGGARGAGAQRLSVVAIGLQTVSGEMQEVVALLPLGDCPTVPKVLDCLREEPTARALRARLEQMKPDAVEIRTARKLLHTAQIAKFRGKWGDESELLGKLGAAQLLPQLVPCDNCQENEEIWAFVGSTVPRATPILVLYMFELLSGEPSYADQIRRAGEGQNALSINHSGLGAASRLEPLFLDNVRRAGEEGHDAESINHFGLGAPTRLEPSFPNNVVLTKETARPQMTDEIYKYLVAMKIEENLHVYEHLVLKQPGVRGRVFSAILFARLVETACEHIGIPYRDRVPVYQKNMVKHGAWMACVDQIVIFYGQKLASWGYKEAAPAPSTFENHRSLHMRALRCVRAANKGKGKESLGQESEALLRSLKEILLTPLDELHKVDDEFPSLNKFTGSVKNLLQALGGKERE